MNEKNTRNQNYVSNAQAMKQEEKRCVKCLYGDTKTRTCGRTPPVIQEIGGLVKELKWGSPIFPSRKWCGEGKWRDEHGNLVGWTDPEEPQSALPPVPESLFSQPHPIHWIRMQDETPPAAVDEKENPIDYLVCWGEGKHLFIGLDWWEGDRWASVKPFKVTHWAHITKPED